MSRTTNVIVAKTSDRASVGLDVFNVGLEDHHQSTKQQLQQQQQQQQQQLNNNGSAKSSSHRRLKKKELLLPSSSSSSSQPTLPAVAAVPVLQRIINIGKAFITNTVLGMAVFSTYEYTIDHLTLSSSPSCPRCCDDPSLSRSSSRYDSVNNNNNDDTDMDSRRGTVTQHFIAGGVGGTANGILLLLLESVKIIPSSNSSSSSSSASSSFSLNASSLKNGHWTTNTNYNNRLFLQPSLSYHVKVPTLHYTTSLVLHNTLSHSILFGTYQLTKQCLEQQQQQHRIIRHLDSGNGTNNMNKNNKDNDNVVNDHYDNIVQFATITISGGFAGQCQYVASYMLERWLGLVVVIDESSTHHIMAATRTTTITTPPYSSSSNISLCRHHFFNTSFYSTIPTIRSIILIFPSSAIGFLAYEYGKLMME